MSTIPPWLQERMARRNAGFNPSPAAPAPAPTTPTPAPTDEPNVGQEAVDLPGAGGPSDPNYGLYSGTETREGLSQKQSYVQQQTGIPSERFDPAWWLKGKKEDGSWRPSDKIIWDSWTPEQRAAAGVPNWDSYQKYNKMQMQHHKPGGKYYEQEQQVKRDAAMMKQRNPGMSYGQILNQLGIFDRPEEGKPLYNKIMQELAGTGTGGVQFDPETGLRYDTATSDLTKRGIGTPMTAQDWQFYRDMQGAGSNPWGNPMARLASPVGNDVSFAKRQQWNESGQSSHQQIPGTNYYESGGRVYDVYGNPVDVGTGQIQTSSGFASQPSQINPYNPNYQGSPMIGGMGYGGSGTPGGSAYGGMQPQQQTNTPQTPQREAQPTQPKALDVPKPATQVKVNQPNVGQAPGSSVPTASVQFGQRRDVNKQTWNVQGGIGGMG